MKKLLKGSKINPRSLTDIYGNLVAIPDGKQFIHLQFRRFSGCPICNVHIGRLVARKVELDANNIKEVIVFYSENEKILENLSAIPFALIGDPKKKLYHEFGVEKSILSVLNPLSWPAAFWGVAKNIMRPLRFMPSGDESMFGLPADFLIDPNGLICELHYGTHAYDQWDFETLISKASTQSINTLSPVGTRDLNT
ncbi:peroxiredoxin-like family protein [Cellvibrio sp.]